MKDYESKDYIEYRFRRAKEILVELEILINSKLWNTAVNRMYYACFYAVGALLIKNKIQTASHSGTRQMFGQHFVRTGKISKELGKHYSELFEKRHKGDYNDFFDFDEETVLRLLPTTKEFIGTIGDLLIENE